MQCKRYTYRTKQKAKRYIKSAQTKVGKRLYPYKCPDCGLFHLTSQGVEFRAHYRKITRKNDTKKM